ncbi:MAG: helix-turn-helix domain-containing protein [Deltaproteobacteria bacterium]|nr:helix-turn-helix domain-containing protein [Deltaproteobacteria bacterium]
MKSLLARRFGVHVRALRKQAALTQSVLAERSGLSVDSVRRIERGFFSPSLDSIAKLCAGLDISLPSFFEAFDRPESGLPGQIAGFLRGRSAAELAVVWRVLRAMLSPRDLQRQSSSRGKRPPRASTTNGTWQMGAE